jgi:hypothetical protein
MEMEGAIKTWETACKVKTKGKTGLKAEWIQWKKKMNTTSLCNLFDLFHI